jgi:hypothetical protein
LAFYVSIVTLSRLSIAVCLILFVFKDIKFINKSFAQTHQYFEFLLHAYLLKVSRYKHIIVGNMCIAKLLPHTLRKTIIRNAKDTQHRYIFLIANKIGAHPFQVRSSVSILITVATYSLAFCCGDFSGGEKRHKGGEIKKNKYTAMISILDLTTYQKKIFHFSSPLRKLNLF